MTEEKMIIANTAQMFDSLMTAKMLLVKYSTDIESLAELVQNPGIVISQADIDEFDSNAEDLADKLTLFADLIRNYSASFKYRQPGDEAEVEEAPRF